MPCENVNAHGSQIAFRFFGLFGKLRDIAVAVHVHDAEAAGFGPGYFHYGDGAGRLRLFVAAQHIGVVHFIDVVAGQHRHILRIVQIHKADVLINGVGSALVPHRAGGALIGRQDVDAAIHAIQFPRLAVADIVVQLQRPVLGQHAHRVDAGVGTVGQGKINDAEFPAEGNGGLCHVAGQHIQAASLSAGQQHGDTLFLHVTAPPDLRGRRVSAPPDCLVSFPLPCKITAPSGGTRMTMDCSC